MVEPRVRKRKNKEALKNTILEGSVYIKTSVYKTGEGDYVKKEETETFAVPDMGGTIPATIAVEESITRNLGNFESGRVTIRLERPCLNNDKAIDLMKEIVATKVNDYTIEELKALGFDKVKK